MYKGTVLASNYSATTEHVMHSSTRRWHPAISLKQPLLTLPPLPPPLLPTRLLLQVLGGVRSLALGRARPICVASAARLIGLLPNLEQLYLLDLLDLSDATRKQVRYLGYLDLQGVCDGAL